MPAKIDLIVWVKIHDLRDYDICSVCTAIVKIKIMTYVSWKDVRFACNLIINKYKKFKANFFVDNNLSYLYQANVMYLFLA